MVTGLGWCLPFRPELSQACPCCHQRPARRRPALAVLDEVTSAVSEQAAAQLYGQLHSEGITCLRYDP